jgi:hypothetical protein
MPGDAVQPGKEEAGFLASVLLLAFLSSLGLDWAHALPPTSRAPHKEDTHFLLASQPLLSLWGNRCPYFLPKPVAGLAAFPASRRQTFGWKSLGFPREAGSLSPGSCTLLCSGLLVPVSTACTHFWALAGTCFPLGRLKCID